LETIWKNNLSKFDRLGGDVTSDTCIIGGGIAGLWAAYKLVKAGQKVCVLEAARVASGVTAGSSAILTYAQDIIYTNLIKKHNVETARKYYEDSKDAIIEIKEIVEKEKFKCDFEATNFVLFSNKLKGARQLRKEEKAYRDMGYPILYADVKVELPYKVKKVLKFDDAYQFDPLKLCGELASYITKNGGQIFENTIVKNAPKDNKLIVETDKKHTVTAKNFIVATRFPFIVFPGFYFLKMYQSQNYSIAFKPKRNENICENTTFESVDEKGFEYRRVGENILCDGVRVRTGQKPYKSKYRVLEKHLHRHFGEYKEITRFCAQDCITMDHLPYAGLYSGGAENVFVISGFNKWGMTNSYITSGVVVDMVLGKLAPKAKFKDNIYTPQRNDLFAGIIETIPHIGVVVASFWNRLFRRGPVCSHMGCKLKWNKDEQTWDCPCHGSRFDAKGQIINNPAANPAEVIK
jgi:glycine/D-amino acid oxidase-like deaminating enzyme